jgi:hypothetical protein
MTPKEKAIELVEHYAEIIEPIEYGVILERNWKSAKHCALIAVEEILNSNNIIFNKTYWEEVKQEIEKL